MKKICQRCGKEFETYLKDKQFNVRGRKHCFDCVPFGKRLKIYSNTWDQRHPEFHKEYIRKWYQKNKKEHYKKVAQRKKDCAAFIWEIKSKSQCSICGEKRTPCLDFHHKDRKEKDIDIAMMVNGGYSTKTIIAEINKCVVLCSNCHRVLHYNERKNV